MYTFKVCRQYLVPMYTFKVCRLYAECVYNIFELELRLPYLTMKAMSTLEHTQSLRGHIFMADYARVLHIQLGSDLALYIMHLKK